MRFLVYEKDLLVRADIFETLTGSFDAIVRAIDDLSELAQGLLDDDPETVLVLSVDGEERENQLGSLVASVASWKLVLISSSSPSSFTAPGSWSVLRRPFTSDGLLQAVKSVISGL